VDKSEMILIFISDGYFSSPNCMRELLRAMHMKKPLLTLMESERRKGALTREEVRMRLKEANENYAKWGLADEMDAWRFPQPSAQQLYDVIFGAREPIEWNRLGIFQDVTLRQIADATLQATLPDTQGKTYLQGELVSQMAEVLKRPSSSYHIYKSQHNPGVDELLKELATWSGTKMVSTPTRRQASMAHLPSPTGSPDPRRSVRRDIGEEESSVVRIRKGVSSLVGNIGAKLKSQPLRVASSPDQLAECDHFLCYLNGRTWTSGETSAAFASEVLRAMNEGVHLLLVHEMPGCGGQEARFGCDFGIFFSCAEGTTPDGLLRRGIYDEIALPLKGGAWREASMALLRKTLAKGGELGDDLSSPSGRRLSKRFSSSSAASKIEFWRLRTKSHRSKADRISKTEVAASSVDVQVEPADGA